MVNLSEVPVGTIMMVFIIIVFILFGIKYYIEYYVAESLKKNMKKYRGDFVNDINNLYKKFDLNVMSNNYQNTPPVINGGFPVNGDSGYHDDASSAEKDSIENVGE